ncbi:MAG: GNAT family N-acetyltransferase [bacterium]|nr:GNAT family N-acetyltransferase [bacterium]
MRTRLRQSLSLFKSRVISFDMQNIYQFDKQLMSDHVARPLAEQECKPTQAHINFQIHDGSDVLEIIDQINPMSEQERSFASNRLDAGDKAVIGYGHGLPVFYGWLMFGEIEMTYGVFLPVPESITFSYNLFTKSSYRRRGLMTGFYEFVRNELKLKENHTLYVGISVRNAASINAHLKNGFEKNGYFYTIKLLGACFTLARFEHAKRFYIS